MFKPAVSTLQASTIDILNVIRNNASYEYQQLVPEITKENQVVAVGEVLRGYPVLANQFINALMNRIALVRLRSALFYNPYEYLKKGYLEYGETIEEIFVDICRVMEYSAEKAESREFKRYLPEVQAAFHTINWRVIYPLTIQQQDLDRAFTSADGVADLITRLIDSIYTAASYDEFLLFKYLIIKGIAHGKVAPQTVALAQGTNQAAITFRTISNDLTFLSTKYNAAGVHNVTPREDQVIFMDSRFNAQFDVEVLAGAFNMDKADFVGHLYLIDNWNEFDNKRWAEIRAHSDGVEEVTAAELSIMNDVVAFIADREWFQVYDNLNIMKEKDVASGLYWNYFYHVWKTVSYSPFSNAQVVVKDTSAVTLPDSITLELVDKSVDEHAVVLTIQPQFDGAGLVGTPIEFKYSRSQVQNGIAVHKYGVYMYDPTKVTGSISSIIFTLGDQWYSSTGQEGSVFNATTPIGTTTTAVKIATPSGQSDDIPVAASEKAAKK